MKWYTPAERIPNRDDQIIAVWFDGQVTYHNRCPSLNLDLLKLWSFLPTAVEADKEYLRCNKKKLTIDKKLIIEKTIELSIIFADDTADIREVYKDYFSNMDIRIVSSCKEVIECYKERPADVVVMDTLDGDYRDVIRKLKRNPLIKIVFISGMDPKDMEELKRIYKIITLEKPLDMSILKQVIFGDII